MNQLYIFALFVAWYFMSQYPVTIDGAFGDRIRPITPNPRYFRRYNSTTPSPTTTVATSTTTTPQTPTEVTISSDLPSDSGSPEPGDDEVPGTPIDELLSNDASYEAAPDEDHTVVNVIETIEDEHGHEIEVTTPMSVTSFAPVTTFTESPTNDPSVLTTTVAYKDLDGSNPVVYHFNSPQLLAPSNENLSSSDTYSQFHYLPPSPYPGGHHEHGNGHGNGHGYGHGHAGGKKVIVVRKYPSPVPYIGPAHKKIIKIIDTPVYRDANPRFRFIKKRIVPRTSLLGPYGGVYGGHKVIYKHKHSTHHRTLQPGYAGIPGTPWIDYPMYSAVPLTGFSCKLTKYPGFYADMDTGCQAWHYCQLDGRHDKFLCPNGTLFNQATRVCDWWYNVDCSSSVWRYNINADLYRVAKGYKKVLHLHPGKAPHVHRIPFKGKGVYSFTTGGFASHPISLQRKIHKHHFLHHPHGKSGFVPRPHPVAKYHPLSTITPVVIPIKSISHHHLHHHQQPHIGHHPHSAFPFHSLKARFGHSLSSHHHPHPHHPQHGGILTVKKIGQIDSHHGHHHHKSHHGSFGHRLTPLAPHHHPHGLTGSRKLHSHHQLHSHKSDHHNHRDILTGKIHHHHHHTGKTFATTTTALLPPTLPLVDDHGRMPHHGHLILHHKLKKK